MSLEGGFEQAVMAKSAAASAANRKRLFMQRFDIFHSVAGKIDAAGGRDRADDGRDAALLRDRLHFTVDLSDHLRIQVLPLLLERLDFQLGALGSGGVR